MPTLPALYLPEKPVSDIEKLTDALSKKLKTESFVLTLPSAADPKKKVRVECFPNALLDSTVRSFFFVPLYRFPLQHAVVTSGFGGIYPKGIPVGSIVSQHSDDTGLLKVAIIETAVDFQRLEDVAIITASREAPPAPIQPTPLSPGAAAAAQISAEQAKAAGQ